MESAREYLVGFGSGGYIGRFRTNGDGDLLRGDEVVVRTERGEEIGRVLEAVKFGGTTATITQMPSGTVVRRLGIADRADRERLRSQAERIRRSAETAFGAAGLPLMVVDADLTWDARRAYLQVAAWGPCDASAELELLSRQLEVEVLIESIAGPADAVRPKSGGCSTCGSEQGGGCGSGGTAGGCSTGGCSSGSCSRGSVRSADDLSAYFGDLRRKMEAQSARIPLH